MAEGVPGAPLPERTELSAAGGYEVLLLEHQLVGVYGWEPNRMSKTSINNIKQPSPCHQPEMAGMKPYARFMAVRLRHL